MLQRSNICVEKNARKKGENSGGVLSERCRLVPRKLFETNVTLLKLLINLSLG